MKTKKRNQIFLFFEQPQNCLFQLREAIKKLFYLYSNAHNCFNLTDINF